MQPRCEQSLVAYARRILPQYQQSALSHESEVERFTRTTQDYPELVPLMNALMNDLEPIENLRNDLSDVLKELNSALSEVEEVATSLRINTSRIRAEVDLLQAAAFEWVPEARLPKPVQQLPELLRRISPAEQDLLRQHLQTGQPPSGSLGLSAG